MKLRKSKKLSIEEAIAELEKKVGVDFIKVTSVAEIEQRRMISDKISENDFQRKVVKYAKEKGWMVHHHLNSRGSEKGWPDLVLIRGERLIFAELKTAKGTATPEQAKWMTALSETGATVYLWRPINMADIMEILR